MFLNAYATRREWNFLRRERKTDKGKEFMIAEGTVKVYLLHLRLGDLRKCVADHSYLHVAPSRCHLSQCLHWFDSNRGS